MEELVGKAKQCLSIVTTATFKDNEIQMLISAAIADLNRQGIRASEDTKSELVIATIMMFVKANFGNTDIKEKELAGRTYSLLCNNLSLSSEFKIKEDTNA